MEEVKICHVSSVHSRYDTRIFRKQATSLAKIDNYKTYYLVLDSKPNEVINQVEIINCLTEIENKSRLKRLFLGSFYLYNKIKDINPGIIHLHDPELMILGVILKAQGFQVIIDVHENTSEQILSKHYLPLFTRKLISISFSLIESWALRKIKNVITATPSIQKKALTYSNSTLTINNFPIISELYNNETNLKKNDICFVGGISNIRGINELSKSLEDCKVKLKLAGEFENDQLKSMILKNKSIIYLGHLNRKHVKDLFSNSIAGIVTYLPVPNHINSQPNKLFEYMSAGLPVIASNFPLWKDIVEKNNCGLCVNPKDPKAIAGAINYLVENPKEAQEMGNNGRQAVVERYNWEIEEKKLINLYNSLLK